MTMLAASVMIGAFTLSALVTAEEADAAKSYNSVGSNSLKGYTPPIVGSALSSLQTSATTITAEDNDDDTFTININDIVQAARNYNTVRSDRQ